MTEVDSKGHTMANDAASAVTKEQDKRQFLLFLLTGGFAALVNFFSRMVFNHWTSFTVAIILAYLCGMVTAFVLNRLFVFRQAVNRLHHQVLWFSLVNLFALAQTILVSLLLAKIVFPRMGITWHAESMAHAVGVLVPVVTSFLGHKHLTFRTR